MKKKVTKILKILLIVLFIGIFIYDTYQIHFKDKKTTKDHLTITYENAGNILLQNINNGSGVSMKIEVKNESDHDSSFELSFLEVVNDLIDPSKVNYTLSKEDGSIEIYSDTFPKESIYLTEGDTVEKGSTTVYILTIRMNNLNPNDIGKTLQARVNLNDRINV